MSASVPSLLATVVISLAFAYVCGLAARAIRLPPLVGYLLAGVIVGPFTPGFVADQHLSAELAEIGVALLLFGVGLHFSITDLLAVWRIAVPGALLQITTSTAIGFAVGNLAMSWTPGASLVLGLSLAIASTVVATRTLDDRGQLLSEPGRVALGWLVMQDLVVILALVLLPAATEIGDAGAGSLLDMLGRTLLQLTGFVAAVLLVGRWAIPWLLARTARTGSRELFTLAVMVTALGIAYGSAALFGVSLALGAFFAGVVLAESDLSHQAAAESLPIQQLFTVLFFVSVGMLFDPSVLVRAPIQIIALLATILAGTGGVTLALLLALRTAPKTAVAVAAALSQIGEFSFILTSDATARGFFPPGGRDLVLAAALLTIIINPFVFRAAGAAAPLLARWRLLRGWQERGARPLPRDSTPERLADHAVLVGHGRVGSVVAEALHRHALPFVIIEQDRRLLEELRQKDLSVVYGDATRLEVLQAAHPEAARLLVIAVPDRFMARRIIELARGLNPRIGTVVRTHTDEEADWLAERAVGLVVMSERETALGMAEYALREFGQHRDAVQATIDALRQTTSAA
jgi:CPA2 family monovalent cation:H+ antiporter-2